MAYMDARAEKSNISEMTRTGDYALSWHEVERAFVRPVATAHGVWKTRKIIIVRLDGEDGRRGYGEIAPIPWFGSPDLPECAGLCRSLGKRVDRAAILSNDLPGVMRFAFGSAVAMLEGKNPRDGHWPLARLLPRGPDALFVASRRIRQGSRCFKYKLVGMPDSAESGMLDMLFETLNAVGGKLRIDMNEAFTLRRAEKCLRWLSKSGGKALDFVEQPMKRGKEEEMRTLAGRTGVEIALDESVAEAADLRTFCDWSGPLVIKPALVGSPDEVMAILGRRSGRTVFSSAFEGPVGLWGCMLAVDDRVPEPLGFGADVWPEGDAWGVYTEGVSIDPRRITRDDMEALWIALFR
jgi:o-succinylbenzoate synthase